MPLKSGNVGGLTVSNGRILEWGSRDVLFMDTDGGIQYNYETHSKYDLLVSSDDSGISGTILFKLNDIWYALKTIHGFVTFGGDELQRRCVMYDFLGVAFGACCATRFLDPEKMEAFYTAPSYHFDDISRDKNGQWQCRIYQNGLSVAYATGRGRTWWGDTTYTTLVMIRPEQGGTNDDNCTGIVCSVVFRDRNTGLWYVSVPIFHNGTTYDFGYQSDWEVKAPHFPNRVYKLWSTKGDYNGGATVEVPVFCLILNYSNNKLTTRLGSPTINVFYEDQPTKTTAKSLLFSISANAHIDDNGYQRNITNYMGEGKTEAEAEAIEIDSNTYEYRVIKKDFITPDYKTFEVWVQNQIRPIEYLDYDTVPPTIQENNISPYHNATFEPLLNSRDCSTISSNIIYSTTGSLDNPPEPILDNYADEIINNPNLFFETEIRPINKPWFTDKDVNVFYFTDSQKAMDFVSFMESL